MSLDSDDAPPQTLIHVGSPSWQPEEDGPPILPPIIPRPLEEAEKENLQPMEESVLVSQAEALEAAARRQVPEANNVA